MSPYMLLHIPANFFADLHIFSYWAGEKGVKSLHVLSHSCREGTRAQDQREVLGGLSLPPGPAGSACSGTQRREVLQPQEALFSAGR